MKCRILILEQGVDSPACKEHNEVSSKLGAQVILRGILGLSLGLSDFPDVDDSEAVAETVIDAESVGAIEGIEVEVHDT